MSEIHPEVSLNDRESRLAAYFDGELDAAARVAFEDEMAQMAQSDVSEAADFAAPLASWKLVGELVRGTLEQEAAALPAARFEQVWDAFDRTLARDARLQDAANASPSIADRLRAWFRPVAVPFGVAAAAALVFIVARPGPDSEPSAPAPMAQAPGSDAQDASSQEDAGPAPQSAPASEASAPEMFAEKPEPQVEPEFFPHPESNEAEIERIEFGGRSGTISQIQGSRGTTTVIWVHEDDEPVDSERSL